MSVQTNGVHDVPGYAAAVRRALVGLGPEQIEDLTDGLEADLAEALADEEHVRHGGDLVELFGTPEEYAAELGAAAGLEPLPPARKRRGLPEDVRHPIRALEWFAGELLAKLRARVWWSPVEEFFVVLRPVWWVARAWVVYQLTVNFGDRPDWLPGNLLEVVWLGMLVILSVHWGRGRWELPQPWRWLPRLVSWSAAIALVPVTLWLYGSSGGDVYYGSPETVYEEVPMDGVVVDGMAVSNLFVYDAEGNPLEGVQIYDDRGRPVRTTYDDGQGQWFMPGDDMPWQFVGVPDEDGRAHWNAYPLLGAHADQFAYDPVTGLPVLVPGAEAQVPPRPFAKAPALVLPEASDEAGSPQGATPSPSAGSISSPTAEPSSETSASPSADASPSPTTTPSS